MGMAQGQVDVELDHLTGRRASSWLQALKRKSISSSQDAAKSAYGNAQGNG
jgi:hypothetical protein